jgi:ribosomal protein L29
MGTPYETDIIAWANEQAELLRSGRLSELDIDHLAEEIEDVGKSEQRELASRLALLLAQLLKWHYQPGSRGSSWQRTIKEQRRAIAAHIAGTPSLKAALANPTWIEGVWADALARAVDETGLDLFPDDCPWTTEQVLSQAFLPD